MSGTAQAQRQQRPRRGRPHPGWLAWLLVLCLAVGVGGGPAAGAPAQKHPRRHKTAPARSRPAPAHRKKPRPAAGPAPKSKAQLERERRANLRAIQEKSQALVQTQTKKKASLGELSVIKEKLVVKQGVIQNISTQLHGLNTDVQQTNQQVLQTRQTLAQLKDEYARLLYTASKTASGFNQLMFLFAADSFNQFALRLRYVRQYTAERQQQAARIVGTQTRLDEQLTGLTQQQRRKGALLSNQLSENKNLLSLKTQQDEVVQQLGQQEQGLRQELAERQQAGERLDRLIAERVREEIARAARAARLAARREALAAARRGRGRGARAEGSDDAPETAAESAEDRRASRVALTPETALVSANFAGNKGRLPWPVGRGFISQRFGRHPHPVLRHVVVENRGIDIQTSAGEPVRACFDGKVLTITSIAGMNTIVMIQHGDYFTVYAKLRSVSVSDGQHVSAREVIGTVAAGADGTSELQFQVWHNSANLNPEAWLGGR
ncbi:murein hydrolase activator EnvC family protein [Hymenobacter caeli]|uniref:Septal ring factor EnvC (AmiA/AmiB activator) n=1 Tax=Hymenobacter caeli TaxID=2735894 RepID=A0ABX2FNG4_9BACT|nr:peptidoglycan DD-metalloendopeptidase family protein [Hymenobacter caeli]NRT17975.1 septal ring factor EnvC (AmiA/AmiB activator) [Hymenobacter caeli]